MKYDELIILLPCHSLEDFPLYHQQEEAEGLLAAYSALWHPALLAAADRLPSWYRGDGPPEKLADKLIVVPQVTESLLLTGWAQRAKSEGACVVRKKHIRSEIVAAALAELDGGDRGVEAGLAADFLALGFCYLHVELLIRQLRQYSNLDEIHLKNETVAAANAAVNGDGPAARTHLQNCFDVLLEARERVYASDAYILDFTLVVDTTIGAALQREIESGHPTNLILAAGLLDLMHAHEPATLAALQAAVAAKQVDILGGEIEERDLPFLPLESVLHGFLAGEAKYREHLGAAPQIYARRRFGLAHVLPQVLAKLGYRAAAHFTLDDGQFPKSAQSKARWEGDDGSSIDVVARVPLDAAVSASFLSLPEKWGESMDLDHVATLTFAHWPGQTSEYYDDLRRIARYAPVLGKFTTASEYFATTSTPGEMSRFRADDYRAPYLKQAVIRKRPQPLSCYADVAKLRGRCDQAAALRMIASALGAAIEAEPEIPLQPASAPATVSPDSQPVTPNGVEPTTAAATTPAVAPSPETAPDTPAIASSAESAGMPAVTAAPAITNTPATRPLSVALEAATSPFGEPPSAELTSAIDKSLYNAAARLAAAVPRQSTKGDGGVFLFNPQSFTRRVPVVLPEVKHRPVPDGPIRSAQTFGDGTAMVVEIPAMGYAWIPQGDRSAAEKRLPKPLAEDIYVRNEFFELAIDKASGGIRSLHDYEARTNRLSQQIAFRMPGPKPKPGDVWKDPDLEAIYSRMVCEQFAITSTGPALGEITTQGKLVDPEGRALARFVQKTQCWLHHPLVVIELDLDVLEPPKTDPWNTYYCLRTAWNDDSAEIFRTAGYERLKTDAKRIETGYFIEAVTATQRTLIVADGLPYHRRIGFRTLDTLLHTRGETRRRFRFGIGLGVEHPFQAAWNHLYPPIAVPDRGANPVASPATWFFHLDRKSVIATSWTNRHDGAASLGCTIRLAETDGRPGKTRLRCLRTPSAARKVDYHGNRLEDLAIDGDAVVFELNAYEWAQVEVDW